VIRGRSTAARALAVIGLLVVVAAPPPVLAGYPERDAGYHDYREMVAEIHQAAADHPDIVRVFAIGSSYKGRTIWAVEVSDNVGVDEGEPEVMLDALHHAREHLTPEMALYALRLLTDKYGSDTGLGRRITDLVDDRRIWIVPMVNPDGLVYDLSGGAYGHGAYKGWRKNRQPTPGTSLVGTDLNRNYGYGWTGGGSALAITYPGPRAWSAPETRAIRDFVLGRRSGGVQRIRTYITFHTTGQLVMWPYSRDSRDVPPDMTSLDQRTLVAMGRHMAASNGYTPRQSGDLGNKPGTAIDWMYGSQRIFAFTFELYPALADKVSRFYPPDEIIGRETERNREALLYLIEMAECPYAAIGRATSYCGPLYDDMEIARGWKVDPSGTDTADAGAWQRGVPAASTYQLGSAPSGRAVLATGSSRRVDVDGGRTTVRSRFVRLPEGRRATLRLRYATGFSSAADDADRFRIQVIDAATGDVVLTALDVRGDGVAHAPRWRTLQVPLPSSTEGGRVAILLSAVDAGPDGTVEAAVDEVRIALADQ
jgi:carboxypeptidase T